MLMTTLVCHAMEKNIQCPGERPPGAALGARFHAWPIPTTIEGTDMFAGGSIPLLQACRDVETSSLDRRSGNP